MTALVKHSCMQTSQNGLDNSNQAEGQMNYGIKKTKKKNKNLPSNNFEEHYGTFGFHIITNGGNAKKEKTIVYQLFLKRLNY